MASLNEFEFGLLMAEEILMSRQLNYQNIYIKSIAN